MQYDYNFIIINNHKLVYLSLVSIFKNNKWKNIKLKYFWIIVIDMNYIVIKIKISNWGKSLLKNLNKMSNKIYTVPKGEIV